ncbi:helix-turn-helix transcriptional regulator [Neobacillus sp. OS1-2]|uniref:helix-turn-helix domain-containing protein n=1 Tax=Neobacillus sp. OS1-2 TaxID=3070680 RepID=UPI0027E211D6|nr:helix-turn-helix transcriptional regulator [Neobacillus sp. OS1-2]WML38667.1 helix-turn-helix transcriptional regulator [Neobacillus sp. OS1-2]
MKYTNTKKKVCNMSMLGKRLKYLREKYNYSQKRVADSIGISNTQLSRYESGDRNPDPELITKFADFYDVTTDYLHGRTDSPKGSNDQYELIKTDEMYDSLAEITKLAKKYGLEQLGFFDIEEWKNLSPEEIKMLDAQFKAVANMAKERNEDKK